MSKYEELREAHTKSRAEVQKYHEDCKAFANQTIIGFKNYLEIPNGNITFLPLDEDKFKKGHSYAMVGKLKEDTYYHVRFRIYFHEHSAVDFMFLIKKCDNHFIIKAIDEDIEHKVNPDNETELTNFYEYLLQMCKEHYETGFQKWLKGEPSQFDKPGFL